MSNPNHNYMGTEVSEMAYIYNAMILNVPVNSCKYNQNKLDAKSSDS